MKKNIFVFCLLLTSCAGYVSPPRSDWGNYLRGASFAEMTPTAIIAKRPVYLGAGGDVISPEQPAAGNYGTEPKPSDVNPAVLRYMAELEFVLYDSLRKPGISVQRAGTDVVVLLVRDALMEMSAPEISETGADTLGIISKILKKYPATFIEISGYTDSMRDKKGSAALSLDMAQRVGVFFARHKINTARMFVVGRGAARPIAAQDDIGRLTNRRIELRLSPAR